MKNSEHWNNYWKEYEIKRSEADKNTKFQCALKLLPQNFESMIDVGGGNGFFIKMVKKSGRVAEFNVVDGSSKAVKKCKEKGINATLADLDGNPLPFESNQFDVVTCLDVLEHVYYPWELLKEIRRVSKEYIIISTPNFAGITNRIAVLKGKPPKFMADEFGNQKPGGHIQFITFNTLKYQLEHLNCTIEEYATQDTLFRKKFHL